MSDRPEEGRQHNLSAFVDGTLDPSRHAEVEAWLASDSEAAARSHAYRRQNEGFAALFGPLAGEAVPDWMRRAGIICFQLPPRPQSHW